ncbi:hypothetical protein H4582DRAFT_513471 [Lactarius indigo]|nr:hypothetical protein H4582DRAFT_513471 [Lactarius indigo]
MGRSPALLPDEEFQLEGHIPDQPNAVLNTMNLGPVSWAAAVAGRQMLTGGLNPSDETCLTDETSSLCNSTPGDASMHRSTQDLDLGIDPNVKIEPEVENVHSPLFFFFFCLGAFPCSRTDHFLFCIRVSAHACIASVTAIGYGPCPTSCKHHI